ncbi:MAG: CHAT domain-containing protein [Flavobacterium haoranii]
MILRILLILFFLSANAQNKLLDDNLKKQGVLTTLDSCLTILNSSEDIALNPKQKFNLTYKIASSYQNLGLKLKASEFYKQAVPLIEKEIILNYNENAKFYNDLSDFYYSISNNKDFKENLIKAISFFEKDNKKSSIDLLVAYEKLINNYLEYGDVNSAKLYLKRLKNLSIFFSNTTNFLHHKFILAEELYSLRVALHSKNFVQSDEIYKKLKKYFLSLKDKNLFINYYAEATNFYAETIFKVGKTNEALKLLEESIILHKKINDKLSLVTVYSYYSYLSREIKNYVTAQQAIDEAIFITEPDNFTDLSGLYINKGILFFLEKNFNKSQQYFDKAHEIIKRISNTDFYLLSYNIEISKKYFEIFEKTGNKKLLRKSFSSYKYSVKQFQDFYENDLFNPLLAEFKNNITEGLLNLGLKSDSSLVETIELIENIQSKYLLKNFLLNTRIANEELIGELSKIKTLKLKLASTSSLQNELNTTSIKNDIQNLEKRIVEKYPNFNSIFDPKFDCKEFFKNNRTEIIRYYTANNSLFAIHLENKNKLSIKKIGEVDSIKKDFSDLVLAINSKREITKLSQKIFNYLLKPFNIQSSELTIISNSFLNELPFEILIDEKGNYLVEKLKINYSNSLPLYEIQRNHKNSDEFKLAIFQPNYNNKKMAILPFAEKEAMFLQNKFKSTLFSGENASKRSFITNASSFNVYHLSMHAIIDEGNEEISRLVFNDSDYYFSDFYSQNLPLDLVVLSACETGLGKYVDGEGLMSLSRAFTYSGVASTVHSLWEIPDKQACEIMQFFYTNLDKGFSKSEALQKAKIEYLKSCKAEELKHPYYWSAFVLNGNSTALITQKSYWTEILLVVLIISSLLFYFLKFRK